MDSTCVITTCVGLIQILLYDDCGKLLDSRFLKKDEVIETGGTLTFDTHLVDIGELEGICKPLRDLNFQRRDEKPTEKTGTQRQKGCSSTSGTCLHKLNKKNNEFKFFILFHKYGRILLSRFQRVDCFWIIGWVFDILFLLRKQNVRIAKEWNIT